MADRREPRPIGEQLASCGGYLVQGPDGQPVGRIAWVRYTTRADCPDTLVVRRAGRFGGRRRIADIPSDRVMNVNASDRTVTLVG